MGSTEQNYDNLFTYFDNMFYSYLFTMIVSLVATIVAWRFTRELRDGTYDENNTTNNAAAATADDDDDNIDVAKCSQAEIKAAKHRALVNQLTSNMTSEQLEEERKVEKAQLNAIFELLKEQQDKFQLTEMQEVEDQLSLYR